MANRRIVPHPYVILHLLAIFRLTVSDGDDKLGFESKIEKLRAEVNGLIHEEARVCTELLTLPLIGPLLTRLLQKGVSEQDIADITELLKNENPDSRKSSSISAEEIWSLITELRKISFLKI